METLPAGEQRIRAWCTRYLAESLNVTPVRIDPNARFARLGLDSAASLFLLVAIEDWLGVKLSAELVFQHQAVAAMAHYLAAQPEVAAALGRLPA